MRTSCFLIHVVSLLSIVTASTYAPQSKAVAPPEHGDCKPCYLRYKRCLLQYTTVDQQLCSCTPAYISCQAKANPLCLDQQNPKNIKALCLSDIQAFTSNGKLSCGIEACDGKSARIFLPMQDVDDDVISQALSDDDQASAASEAQSDAESANSEAQSDAESAASEASEAASDAESAAESAQSDAESAASSLLDDDDFPGWAIALIIVGGLLLLLALVGALLAMKAAKKKKKNRARKAPIYAPPPPPPPPVVAPPPPALATAAPVVYNDGFYDYPYEASMYSGMDPYY